ncbi:MAG: UDP-N-acetylmuramoyl-L-alanyl-D-glutamate--2,6-diaminopimelate ligase [Gammaproteobacteria bacterium]
MLTSQLHAAGITGLCQHSGRVSVGDAFIAYRGEARDGRDFILDVVARGAKALVIDPEGLTPEQEAVLSLITIPVFRVQHLAQKTPELAEAFYNHPSRHLHVIAATGTNGKSSIVFGINQMYRALDVPVAMIGTLGIGTLDHYVDNPLTTPDPVSLQRNLAEMFAQGIETVAMEASSHALDQGRLGNTEIHVAIFTNLTQDHMDYHQTMEAYGEAKALLYKMPSVETIVINLDDAWCFAQCDKIPSSKKVIGYTCQQKTHPRCDLLISAVKQGEGYGVSEGGTTFPFHPQLIGDFNVSNLLAMIGAMRVDGFALNVLVQIAERVSGIPGRLECVSFLGEPRVVVDFAHTPDALLKALLALRPTVKGKLWCVFGCGGGRDITKRPIMGEIAAKYADHVVITTDNARNDSPEAIAQMILAGIPSGKTADVILDRAEAITKVIQSAAVDDTVLIAGKGHEKTQTIGGVVTPFSDQATARSALDERRQR